MVKVAETVKQPTIEKTETPELRDTLKEQNKEKLSYKPKEEVKSKKKQVEKKETLDEALENFKNQIDNSAVKNQGFTLSHLISDEANVKDAKQRVLESVPVVGDLFKAKRIAKDTAINTMTNMGTGALKTLEGAADTVSDLVVNPWEQRINYAADYLTKGKKVADENLKDLKKMQQRDIKKNMTQDFQDKTGYSDVIDDLEKNSLVKRENLGGQVAQGVGGMVPALVLGQAFGGTPELTNTAGLTGKEKAAAILGNVGKTYVSQMPSNAVLGASSYGSGTEEALNEGATMDQARKYGLLNAAIEQGTEMMTGGIPGLGGKGGLDSAIEPIINKNTNGYVNALLKAGQGAFGEGLEEYTGAMLDPLAKKVYSDEKIDWNKVRKDARQAGITGAITGALLNSPQTTQDIQDVKTEKKIRNVIGDSQYAEGNQQYNPEYKGWEKQRQQNAVEEQQRQEESANRREEVQRVAQERAQKQAQEQQNQQTNTITPERVETPQNNVKNADLNNDIKSFEDVKQDYKYYKNADLENFDTSMLDKAKETIQANKQGKRTKQEWLDIAQNIGQQAENLDSEQLKKLAFESFAYEKPNGKDNLNRQGNKYVGFGIHEWVKAVYDGAGVGKPINTQNITNQQVDNKQKQFEIVNNTNPMQDEYHTGIRSKDDIRTWDEVMNLDDDTEGQFAWGDYSREDALRDKEKGTITIYSSKPIENGNFVSTSKIQAEEYAGGPGNKIYSKEVPLNEVAWINGDEGQYAKVENNNIPAEMEKEPVIVAKNNNGQEIKLKQSKSKPGVYNQEAISRDIKDINNQYKNKVVKGKNGMEVSNFYSNITEKSKFIDTDIRNMFKNENDLQFYKTVSNEESLNKANKEIGNTIKSQEKAFDDFISKKEQFDSTDMAKGWILLERFNQAADYDRAYLVAKQMKEMGTKSGQAIQMLNLQSRLTPEGMYKWAVSELMEAENKFNSEKGRTKQEIEKYRDSFRLTAEETEFIKNQMEKIQDMPQGREKNIELAKINSMLQDKLPHQKGQSLKSWMRISMLFNPKTQVRNVMGNTIITPVNAVSDVFASGVDKLISKKTGKRTIGAPSLGGLAAYGKGALQGIKEATQDYRLGIDTKNINQDRFDVGKGKAFNENHSGPLKGLRNKVAKGLNATNDLLGYVMDVGDRAFYQGSVENSLYNQQKINNTKEITNEMREIAENEGLQRTWNDNNEYTKAVLDLRRAINNMGEQLHLHVGEYGLGDLLIPFAKTPANLTKAIVDYSPVGYVNAIVEGRNLKNAIETGNYTAQQQHDFAQTVGKATAGTLLYALGVALAKAKITSGDSDSDKDLKNFMRYNLGIQPYSIKVGDKSFTYDWAQPIAAPFAITANIEKGMEENMSPEQALQHFLTTGFDVLSEQSFLSGINEVFNDNDGILSGILQQIINIPSTAMPTLLKQFTDMVDGTKRQTYSKEGKFSNMVKTAKSKDPVGSKTLAPQVDVLGNEIKKYGGDNNAFNVFLNPANMEKGKKTPVAEEIYSLYEATQDKTIIPRKVDYSTKINGENKVLTTEEMEKWQKASGKMVTDEVQKAMNNYKYKQMNDDQKAKVINKIVNYSYQKAKSTTFNTPLAKTFNGVEKAISKGYSPYEYYINLVLKESD